MSQIEFIDGLQQYAYVSHANHSLLAIDAASRRGANIGKNGVNLTISFLSLNRTALSERLLLSIQEHIPEFAGEVLIIDNGSSINEIARLREICQPFLFKWRIVELGENFGVAGGRNRTISHVLTDWLMCLDNDIYFTRNPLLQIQKDLAQLGCHFMSLPLFDSDAKTIFARGGHIYISLEHNQLHIGAGSACAEGEAFLSTFLFGGACVFNKDTFSRVGGYDDAMFVGFEDIDFSIRLFQQGYKVGSTAILALVHDHPKPVSGMDKDYEKERFSRKVLHDSARYMEAKHGFSIWSDAVDTWLVDRQKELDISTNHQVCLTPKVETEISSKPCIGLIIDTEGWAFSNIARQLERYLSDRFEFVIIPMDIIDNINQVLLLTEKCQLVHFFWREHLRLIGTPYYRQHAESLCHTYADFEARFILTKKLTTSIYDHLLLEEAALKDRACIYQKVVQGYSVGSQKLNKVYGAVLGYPTPSAVLEDGVDLTLFRPQRLERFDKLPSREFVVGWVGNSQWAAELEDFKGVHTILKPAIELLRAEGINVRAKFADRQDGFIPHAQMPNYYAGIDVYVCTSKIEGTPNPVLEAMACGVPVFSTDVGIVPQAFGELQRDFILQERTVNAVADALRELIANPQRLRAMSIENLEMIKVWDWSIKAEKFAAFFNHCLV